MNTKFKVDYIPDDQGNIRVLDISLSPKEVVGPLKNGKKSTLFLDNGKLFYTTSSEEFTTIVLKTNKVYENRFFHSRKYFVTKLLKKWSPSSKEVEIPIKVVAKPKVKARPKLKHSPHGIQVDVVRVPQSNDYLVTRVQALRKKDLPLIYTAEGSEYTIPRVWQERDALIANNCHALLRVGETYSYGALKKALLYIELAGRHLTVANQHMKLSNDKWVGSNWITFKDGLLLKDTTFQKRKEAKEFNVNGFWLGSLIC